MIHPPDSADWYFSREGYQSGPLTYAELKEKADEGVLHPRTDLVWREGMPDWVPIGEIDGLFTKVAPPPAAPAELPLPHETGEIPAGLEFWPGSGRFTYLISLILLPSLCQVILLHLPDLYRQNTGSEFPAAGNLVIPALFALLIIWITLRRFTNLGMSPWWFLGQFVPILNLWLGYRTVACPAGYAWHKKLDLTGWLLAFLYWFFLIAIAASVILLILAAGGNLDSQLQNHPELRQQLQELLEQGKSQPGTTTP